MPFGVTNADLDAAADGGLYRSDDAGAIWTGFTPVDTANSPVNQSAAHFSIAAAPNTSQGFYVGLDEYNSTGNLFFGDFSKVTSERIVQTGANGTAPTIWRFA